MKQGHTDVGVEISGDQSFDSSRKGHDGSVNWGPFGNNLDLDSRVREFPYVTSKRKNVEGICYCIAEASKYLGEWFSVYFWKLFIRMR